VNNVVPISSLKSYYIFKVQYIN